MNVLYKFALIHKLRFKKKKMYIYAMFFKDIETTKLFVSLGNHYLKIE